LLSVLFINSQPTRTSSNYIHTAARRSVTTAALCCMVCSIKALDAKVSDVCCQNWRRISAVHSEVRRVDKRATPEFSVFVTIHKIQWRL